MSSSTNYLFLMMLQALIFLLGDHILVSAIAPVPSTFSLDDNIRNSSETGDITDLDDRLGRHYMPLDNNHIAASLAVRQKDYKFLVEVLIGMPPKKQTLVLDIGSDLTWVQCYPLLQGFTQLGAKYIRFVSRSFETILGTDERCDRSKGYRRTEAGTRCDYKLVDRHNDMSSRGFLARDVIIDRPAGPSGGGQQMDVLMLFGCSDDNDKIFYKEFKNIAGVFGLGSGGHSFPSQFLDAIEGRFAYCIPGDGGRSSLRFGGEIPASARGANEARILPGAASSHFRSKYKLELTGVGVEGKRLEFLKWNYECVIDTRDGVSRIPRWMHQRLTSEISGFFHRRGVARSPKIRGTRLCYLVPKGFTDYPTISFHFAGGGGGDSSMVLDSRHLFHINKASLMEGKDVACFAIQQNRGASNVVTIGVMQQMHTGFIFDLRANLLTFFPDDDCANF